MRKLIAATTAALFVAGCTAPAHPWASQYQSIRGQAGTAYNAQSPLQKAQGAQAARAKAPDAFLRITYITANGLMGSSFTAPPNHHVRFRAYTSADWNARLDWTWRAWGPIFGFDDTATWTTPTTEGTYTVDVQVRDRDNGWDWKTLYFRVEKDARFQASELGEAEKAGAQGPVTREKR